MSAFVASNAKYYKKSQVAGLIDHIKRNFENDLNVYSEFSFENFGHKFADFVDLENRMLEAKKSAGLRARGFQKDANVMVDNVLVFDRAMVEGLKAKNPTGYKQELLDSAIEFSEIIRQRYGLEPMNIDFHWDEGRYKDEGDEENYEGEGGERIFLNNYHAHVSFMNFDFSKLNQPLRNISRKDFSGFQDASFEAFSKFGFERGIPKSVSGRKHLSKAEFVKQEYARQEELYSLKIKEINDNFDIEAREIESDHKKIVNDFSVKKEELTSKSKNLNLKYQEQLAQYNGLMHRFNDSIAKKRLSISDSERVLAINAEKINMQQARLTDLAPTIELIEHVRAHREQFDEFLETRAPDGIREQLKRAIELLREHGIDFQTKIGRAVDRGLDLFNKI